MKKSNIYILCFIYIAMGVILTWRLYSNEANKLFVVVYYILMMNVLWNLKRSIVNNEYVGMLRSRPGFSFETHRSYALFWVGSDCFFLVVTFLWTVIKGVD